MADMSQVNLERLRATDAMWEETKHPRADNGQFTSGSGGGGGGGALKQLASAAKVSKFQGKPATHAKVSNAGTLKRQTQELNKYVGEVSAHKSPEAKKIGESIVNRGQKLLSKEKRKLEAAGETLAKARPGIAKMREQAKAAQPSYEDLTKRQNNLFHKVAEASRQYGPGSPEHKAARAEYDKAYAEWAKADNERQGTSEDKNWVRRKLGKEKYDKVIAEAEKNIKKNTRVLSPEADMRLRERDRKKEQAKAAAKPKASGSGESHAKALESLAKDFKQDYFISSYAKDLAKAAREGGEAAVTKRAEELANEIEKSSNPGFTKAVQNNRLEYVLNQYKSKVGV